MLEFLLGVLIVAAVFGILAVSLDLQAGITGLLNFGLVAFFALGAYATGIGALHGVAWPVSALIGMALAVLAGAGIGLLGRTLAAEYWAIATLALAELLRLVTLNADSLTRGPQGIADIRPFFAGLDETARDLAWLGVIVAALAVCAFVAWRVRRTQFGRVLKLVREREQLAASLGHDVVWAKVRVLAVSGPMAALAGSLYAHYLTYIGPTQLEPFQTFVVWTMVVVGGLGSLTGVLLGALLVQLLYELTRFLDDVLPISVATAGGLRIMIVGAALLGFMFWRPEGIVPERLSRIDARG